MKRIIVRAPEGIRLELLTPEQQSAIAKVFTQFVNPMPGAIAADGYELIDGVVGDNFELEAIGELGLPFILIGLWQWDGKGAMVELEPYDKQAMLRHLPPVYTYDDEGNVVSERPQTDPTPPHQWAGWPPVPIK